MEQIDTGSHLSTCMDGAGRVAQPLTYVEVARILAEEAWVTVNYSYSVYRRRDNLLRFPGNKRWRSCKEQGDAGEIIMYNRVLILMTGSIPLAEAWEIEGTHRERVEAIDAVNGAMVNAWQGSVTRHPGENGRVYIDYPFAIQEKERRTAQTSEDITHGSMDSRDFQLIFLSGRYNFTAVDAVQLANTIADKVYLGGGSFARRLHIDLGVKKNIRSLFSANTTTSFDGYV